jgi:hypothetical protein
MDSRRQMVYVQRVRLYEQWLPLRPGQTCFKVVKHLPAKSPFSIYFHVSALYLVSSPQLSPSCNHVLAILDCCGFTKNIDYVEP